MNLRIAAAAGIAMAIGAVLAFQATNGPEERLASGDAVSSETVAQEAAPASVVETDAVGTDAVDAAAVETASEAEPERGVEADDAASSDAQTAWELARAAPDDAASTSGDASQEASANAAEAEALGFSDIETASIEARPEPPSPAPSPAGGSPSAALSVDAIAPTLGVDATRAGAEVEKPERPGAESAEALQSAGEALTGVGETLQGLGQPGLGEPGLGEPAAGAAPSTASDARDVAQPTLAEPTIDIVRVEPDGDALIAGRAAPGATVSVEVDGAEAITATADRRGEFVAIFNARDAANAPSGPAGLSIGLVSVDREGRALASAEPVIIGLPDAPGAPPIAVRPTPRGPELVQPAPLSAGVGVSIDTVSYDAEGAVQITGRGAPGQVARLYLDDALEVETRVDDSGSWIAELPRSVEPEVYRLRVDQIADDGGVTGRAETPFERAPIEDVVVQDGGVVVQPGNNLWRIASHLYGDGFKYQVIFSENRDQIRDPDLIYPGQIFALPSADVE